MKIDFHCHSIASDGTLSPGEVLTRARERGVEALAITDHDTVAAYDHLPHPAPGIRLVTGIELSCLWHRRSLHIVGLGVSVASEAVAEAVSHQAKARNRRAGLIARRLAGYGVDAPLEGALAQAGGAVVGRPHFARHMVASGFVASEKIAFKKFLGSGKSCDIKTEWPDLARVITWIRDAGGIPVLAHPGKYNLGRSKLRALVAEFATLGGEALEVVSGRQIPVDTAQYGALCREFGLLASWGSDFHSPDQEWLDLGRYSAPPTDVTPVWQRLF